jgi:hypothetical protein
VTPNEVVVETVSETVTADNKQVSYQRSHKLSIADFGSSPVCHICSNMMVFAEGCMKCPACGYSKCG